MKPTLTLTLDADGYRLTAQALEIASLLTLLLNFELLVARPEQLMREHAQKDHDQASDDVEDRLRQDIPF